MQLNKKGFTLVEALIVIILIAIGAAIAFSFLGNPTKEGRETADVATVARDASTVAEGWNKTYAVTGKYPTAAAELVADGTLKAMPKNPIKDGAYTELMDVKIGGVADTVDYFYADNIPVDICKKYNAKYAGADVDAAPAVSYTAADGLTVKVINECVNDAGSTKANKYAIFQHLNN